MKKKFLGLKYIKKEEGFVLITILMIFVIVSILGIGLLSVSTSNFRQTGSERDFQAVYYIAEAGINQAIYDIGIKVDELSDETLSHVDFFEKLNDFIDTYMGDDGVKTLDNFEESFGEKPVATISVVKADDGLVIEDEDRQTKGTTNYVIRSVGKIGRLSRTVSTSIKVAHGITKETESSHHPAFDYALYSPFSLTLQHQSKIDGSIYSEDITLSSTGTKVTGDVVSNSFVSIKSNTFVEGNVYALGGKVEIGSSSVNLAGDIHASDNVELGHKVEFKGNIYTNGDVGFSSSEAKITGDIHSGGNVSLGWAVDVNNIFTNGNVKFDGNNIINGEIHAGGVVGDKYIGNNVTVWGNVFSNSHVYTRNYNNYVYKKNVYAGKDIYIGNECVVEGYAEAKEQIINNGTIKGGFKENGNALEPQSPIPPYFDEYETMNNKVPLHTFEIGISNINQNQNSVVHNILPGAYNNLTLKWNDTLRFSSGNYYFNNLTANESAIKLQLDISSGPIKIYSKGDINFGGNLEVSVLPKGETEFIKIDDSFLGDEIKLNKAIEWSKQVYWESHNNFKIGNEKIFLGSILADNDIEIGWKKRLIGAYAVNEGKITLGTEPIIIYAPPISGSSSGSGGVNEEGQNNIPSGYRITTSSPIREK